ncbi:MAG TPA: c-type cytochrome [Usitatibacter sp.]|jgi:cytochrome c5|nr:c-type cytochrome [Usitatibacter sp.]
MSQHSHHDPAEGSLDTHPVKLGIAVVIGAAALIIGILLLADFAVGSYGARSMKGEPAMQPAAVARRLAPVAKVVIDPNAPVAPAAAAAPATATVAMVAPASAPAAAAGGAGVGKATYDKVCFACHATGLAGSPKFGDKAAWAPRIAQGKDTLHASALHGKGAMPAKGGNPALPDADVIAAVDYMAGAAK